MEKSPVYRYPADYARDNGELELYRSSMKANSECKEAIEAAIRDGFDGMHLNTNTAKTVIDQYGYDRLFYVLAYTVQKKDWDGRFSIDNKAWAQTIPIYEDMENRRFNFVVNSHPAVLDGFINQVRRSYLLTQPLTPQDIEKEAGRILRSLQSEHAPNSPNGTHFMAQISQDFLLRASTKDYDRLFALLPFKSLTISNLNDRKVIFTFISKDETRDKPLRQPKKSVRRKLESSPKAQSPTAAKRNDLER